MPQPSRPARTPPVVFDEAAWAEDMLRASRAARSVAMAARSEFEHEGVLVDRLRACQTEGPDATSLPRCMKVYLPAPAGLHGMVFELGRVSDRLGLLYAGFGLRHPGRETRQPSVYEIAHRRLHRTSGS